jgi:hypothetical protein
MQAGCCRGADYCGGGFDKTQNNAAPVAVFISKIELLKDGPILQPPQPIATAPFDRDLELSVIEKGQVYSLVFACRRTESGWIKGGTKKPVLVDPTHWREWSQ